MNTTGFDPERSEVSVGHLNRWAVPRAMRLLMPLVLAILGCVAVPVAEHAKQVTITTRPRLEDRGQFTYLFLIDEKHNYELIWSISVPQKYQLIPVMLDTNRVYTFTVAEEPFEGFDIPTLHRVQKEGQTIYDIEICEVHKIKMEHKEVRILYGLVLPGPDAPSADTERQLFPHHREYSFGGCVVTPDDPKTVRCYVCADCKKAYGGWNADEKKAR